VSVVHVSRSRLAAEAIDIEAIDVEALTFHAQNRGRRSARKIKAF